MGTLLEVFYDTAVIPIASIVLRPLLTITACVCTIAVLSCRPPASILGRSSRSRISTSVVGGSGSDVAFLFYTYDINRIYMELHGNKQVYAWPLRLGPGRSGKR